MRRSLRLAILISTILVPSVAAGQPASSDALPCQAAPTREYGYTNERPIQVGGGPMYGARRQQRYLSTLRGPQGQVVTWERRGSARAPDGDTMLDLYTVRYEGIDAPVTLFLDFYHFSGLTAPSGFGCASDFDLGMPPPDPFAAAEQLEALGQATAAAATGPIAPIPLGENGSAGFVLDRFRVIARPAPPGAFAPPAHRTIVVIKPQACEGRTIAPTAINLVNGSGQQAGPIENFTMATRFSALATGVDVPEGSLGAVFQVDGVVEGVRVRATFSDTNCTGDGRDQSWPLVVTDAELADSPMPVRPKDDQSGVEFVAIQAVVDHAGALRELRALGGPDLLVQAALDAVKTWRLRPPAANGAPLTRAVVVRVVFEN